MLTLGEKILDGIQLIQRQHKQSPRILLQYPPLLFWKLFKKLSIQFTSLCKSRTVS